MRDASPPNTQYSCTRGFFVLSAQSGAVHYPMKDQFIDKLPAIQKTYIKEFIALIVFGILTVISIFCWIKHSSNKLIWLALELASVIFIYCITIISGMVFKKKLIKLIKAGEI